MIIRRLTKEDVPDAALLEKSIFSVPWSENQLMDAFEKEYYRFVGAFSDDKLTGYGGMYYALDEADIANIAVDEKFRRKGIGRQLLNALTEMAKQEGIVCMFLEVRASNKPAIHLYESEGFVPVGRRKDYYESPREDALLYALKFEQ